LYISPANDDDYHYCYSYKPGEKTLVAQKLQKLQKNFVVHPILTGHRQ